MQLEKRRWPRNLNGSGNRGQMRLDRSLVCAGILSHISREPRERTNLGLHIWKKKKMKGGSNQGCFRRFPWLNCSWKTGTYSILNPTSIKLGLVISSSLAHVKRLVIHFYLFKHVKSCQCWFSWRISRASWQMSLMLFAAACNLGLLALAVLGFAICAELSFLMISPNPAEERFWRSWKQWEWWRNGAFLGLHGSFPAEGWEIVIIRDYLETRCSDQVSTKRNWLFQWALWQQFLKLQGMDGTGWEVNSDSAIGHWIVIGSLTAVSAAKQAPGSPEMPQCVEFMIFLYDLVKQGKRFYESHMCLVLFIWYS